MAPNTSEVDYTFVHPTPGHGKPVDWTPSAIDDLFVGLPFPTALLQDAVTSSRTHGTDRFIAKAFLPILTIRELLMLRFMNAVTDKPGWQQKVFDDTIVAKWQSESVSPAPNQPTMTDHMFDFCVAELRHKAMHIYNDPITPIVVYNADIVKSETAVPASVKLALQEAVKVLENVPECQKDWHPGSSDMVLDLVHPSLFPLIYGQTRVLKVGAKVVALDDCVERCGEGEVLGVDEERLARARGMFGRMDAYSSRFQWLPCEVDISGEGAKITSYINNLHPKHTELYDLIEKIIDASVPLWEQTLAPMDILERPQFFQRIECNKVIYERRRKGGVEVGTEPEYDSGDYEEGADEDEGQSDLVGAYKVVIEDGAGDTVQIDPTEDVEEGDKDGDSDWKNSDSHEEDPSVKGTQDHSGYYNDEIWDELQEMEVIQSDEGQSELVGAYKVEIEDGAGDTVQTDPTEEDVEGEYKDGDSDWEDGDSYGDSHGDDPSEHGTQDQNGYYDDEIWDEKEEVIQPEPEPFDAEEFYMHEPLNFKELYGQKGRPLQVIVKLANIELTPEKPRYDGGTWHVEGKQNERICATSLYYYSNHNTTPSHLSFKHFVDEDTVGGFRYEQDDHRFLDQYFGCQNADPGVQYIGDIETKEGRLLTFPNILQHQVQPFELADPTKPGHRKIVALFLIDPNVRVVSTAHVPVQRLDWWRETLESSAGSNGWRGRGKSLGLDRLPVELRDKVFDEIEEFPITLNEAKVLRGELMEERKAFVRAHKWAVREYNSFSLCEH